MTVDVYLVMESINCPSSSGASIVASFAMTNEPRAPTTRRRWCLLRSQFNKNYEITKTYWSSGHKKGISRPKTPTFNGGLDFNCPLLLWFELPFWSLLSLLLSLFLLWLVLVEAKGRNPKRSIWTFRDKNKTDVNGFGSLLMECL